MHQALLIDEIVQVVFDSCLDFGSGTLTRVARTCKAWRDPALDRLWYRLTDVTPLLQLVPGVFQVNGVYVFESPVSPDLRILRLYAPRVKHVVQRRNVQLHPHLSSILSSVDGLFTQLVTVQLSLVNCHSLCSILGPGTALKSLDMDLGFHPGAFENSNSAACNYLAYLPSLRSLSLRGSGSEALNRAIAATSQLHSLSLRLSTSLNVETIAAISTFPELVHLEVHASHIRAADLANSLRSSNHDDGVFFPSLQSLNIRSSTSLAGAILQKLQSTGLRTIYLDVEPVAQTDDAWITLFNIMKDRTPNLHDFTIDHHIDTEDPGLDSHAGHANLNDNNDATTSQNDLEKLLRFELLHPLSSLRDLQRIVFDTTPPIMVRDEDLEKLGSQWPKLAHLDLGSVPTVDPRWAPKVTLEGLASLSTKPTNLRNLIIPIDPSSSLSPNTAKPLVPRNTLRNITISTLSPPDTVAMASCLANLFPFIEHVDGAVDHDEQWHDIQTAIRDMRSVLQSN
ncbi:hypothetical protein V5O48_006776 [Marasmius crinis-equi]|uniref:F-box domain-containing protein n=1 Tax=Marasmius crinis-equi TaxID=585013 RepID=A0ABR3FIL2_9AGAR